MLQNVRRRLSWGLQKHGAYRNTRSLQGMCSHYFVCITAFWVPCGGPPWQCLQVGLKCHKQIRVVVATRALQENKTI